MIINCFYGGPGSGKSTTAATKYADAKIRQVNCELVCEYIKQWAWENRKPVSLDQFYFFAQQSRKEYSLLGKVDEIFTDSPVSITVYYTKVVGNREQSLLFKEMFRFYEKSMIEHGCVFKHFWVKRGNHTYNPNGRIHTEKEALAIDIDMRTFLNEELGIILQDC